MKSGHQKSPKNIEKRKKLLIKLISSFLLLLISIPISTQILIPVLVKNAITSKVTEELGLQASVKDVSVNLGGSAIIRGVIIRNAESGVFESPYVCNIAELSTHISPWDILRGRINIDQLNIQQNEWFFEKNAEGLYNYVSTSRQTENENVEVSKKSSEKDQPKDSVESKPRIQIHHLTVNNSKIVFLNSRDSRYSGKVTLAAKNIIAEGLDFSRDTPFERIEATEWLVDGPHTNYEHDQFLYLEKGSLKKNDKCEGLSASLSGVDIYLQYRPDETNRKRIRRVIESTMKYFEDDEEEEEDESLLSILNEKAPAKSNGKIEDGEAEKTLANLNISGMVTVQAYINDEWQHEDAILNLEYNTCQDEAGTTLTVKNEVGELLYFRLLEIDGELEVMMKANEFPFHALLWKDQLSEDFEQIPKVDHALVSINAEAIWVDGRTSGSAKVRFSEVEAERDQRPVWERFRVGDSDVVSGWATILNDMTTRGSTESKTLKYAVNEDVVSSSPLMLLNVFQRRFHEERLKPGP